MTDDKETRKKGAIASDALSASADFDEIRARFVEEWEAGENPTLQAYVERYPQFAEELMDFVLSFVQLEDALADTPEVWTPSAETERARQRALAGPCGPATTVAEVRKSMGWSVRQLARATNLPAEVITWTEQGLLTDYPLRFERKLGEALCRSPALVTMMLQKRMAQSEPPRVRRRHLHASGQPAQAVQHTRSFREALLECDHMGKLTSDMRAEWLDEEAP